MKMRLGVKYRKVYYRKDSEDNAILFENTINMWYDMMSIFEKKINNKGWNDAFEILKHVWNRTSW